VAQTEALQVALGQIRRSRGHYPGKLVLIDPHRIQTWSKRQMPLKKANRSARARKMLQTFFATDADSSQPYALGIGSSALTATQATKALVDRIATILSPHCLLIADVEHFTVQLLKHLGSYKQFSFLIPRPNSKKLLREISAMDFSPNWAGYAVAESKYQLSATDQCLRQIVQRTGETQADYRYKAFVTNSQIPAADLMTRLFPQRWNIEEFFNLESALGWNRASTLNLHIRLAKLTMALIAQGAIYQLRTKLSGDIKNWTAQSMARKLFNGIDGDLKVKNDTIVVTFYNAPQADVLKKHYVDLPQRLEAERIDPRVPWLYNFKVDYRFK
jgi:hypothetical protein